MTTFMVRRAIHSLVAAWGVVTLVFLVLRAVPGDPAAMFAGPSATLEQIEAVRIQLNLDRPISVQYVDYMRAVLALDFGESYRWGQPVIRLIAQRLPATMLLASSAMLIAVLLSLPLGALAAMRNHTRTDRVISVMSLVGQAIPNFWVGIMLILVFAGRLRLLPSFGYGSWQNLIMPAFTLALPMLGVLVRLVRAGLLEVMGEDYIRVARARGLNELRVVYKHAGRNMLIPVVTMIGLQFGILLGGSVVVETVYGWPGIGRLLIEAVSNRDYAVVQAVVLTVAVLFLVINFLVDVSYGLLDPRVRRS